MNFNAIVHLSKDNHRAAGEDEAELHLIKCGSREVALYMDPAGIKALLQHL